MPNLSPPPASATIAGIGLQAAGVIAFSASFGLMANALSPRGLDLGRDYFPPRAPAITPPAPDTSSPPPATAPPVTARSHEFASVSRAAVEEMTRDPRFVTRNLLLIDARNDALYQAGHIPGALQFDHYRPQQHLATILPACLAAGKIVIYCNGGSCEDSHFAARLLRDLGVPQDRLSIYDGGFEDWQAAALPVRSSGR